MWYVYVHLKESMWTSPQVFPSNQCCLRQKDKVCAGGGVDQSEFRESLCMIEFSSVAFWWDYVVFWGGGVAQGTG